jgi:hypothetical protein
VALEELRQPQPAYLDYQLKNASLNYGLGWDYTSIPEYEQEGIQVIGKAGDSMNYAAMLFTIPKLRLSVAVIETGSNPEAFRIAKEVLDQILIGKDILKETEEKVSIPLEVEPVPSEYKAFEGYYGGSSGNLYQVQIDEESNSVNIFSFNDGQMIPAVSFFYKNGYLYDENVSKSKCYFSTLGDQNYFVYSSFDMDFLYMEKLEALDEPKSLMIGINGVQWLRRNVKPYEFKDFQYNHIQRSYTLEYLPGYCFFSGIQRIVSPSLANFAAKTMRDQKDLKLFKYDNTVWAQTSDMIYSPATDIAVLEKESESITIGSEGYSEWIQTDKNTVITYTIPETGRVVVFSPDGLPVYDSLSEKPEVYVEENSFIEFIGYPEDTFYIHGLLK